MWISFTARETKDGGARADKLAELSAAQHPIQPAVLLAHKHFERAFAVAATAPDPELVEFSAGSNILVETALGARLQKDFDLPSPNFGLRCNA